MAKKGETMRKVIMIIFISSFIFLSCSCSPNKKSAITIGNIKITADEFESSFARSIFGKSPSLDNRQKFLRVFIDRKLILGEAQNSRYDRDPEFLEGVQSFWEQSLLKLTLNKKIKELSSEVNVGDQEVVEYYKANKQDFSDKDLAEVYGQIKLQLFKKKQRLALDEWVNSLKKKNKIEIDHKLLGLK